MQPSLGNRETGEAAIHKVRRHLVPFAMLLFFIALIDRANISYAALQMNADLHLDPAAFGTAAGIFFLGYVLFEIPSNLALARVGARLWLGRIMISWGIVASAMAWVTGSTSLNLMRFLLGVAEAGLLPGLFFYVAGWVPGRSRGVVFSTLMLTTALAYIVGGPLSTGLLALNGLFGLRGWQIMFLAEGVPAIIVGAIVLVRLLDKPAQAKWLSADECDWLINTIAREQAEMAAAGSTSVWVGLTSPKVLVAALFAFFQICINFGLVFWLPQIIKSFGALSDIEVGLLSVVPYACAGAGMIAWGRHSDRTGDRRWHLVVGALVAAAGYACSALAPTSTLSFVAICVAAMGVWSTFGVLWAYAGDRLSGPAAATGFALINSIGSIGGFVGPVLVGQIRQHTASFSGGLLVLSGFAVMTAVVALFMRDAASVAVPLVADQPQGAA